MVEMCRLQHGVFWIPLFIGLSVAAEAIQQQGLRPSGRSVDLKNSDSKLEQFFRSTLELVRPEMKNGNKELKIDIVDPLSLPDYRFEKPGEILEVLAYFSHIKLPKLSTFKLDRISADENSLRVDLWFSFPMLSGVGDYLFQTKTFGLPVVSASDRFEMLVTGIKATGRVQLVRDTRGKLTCQSIELQSTEDKVEITMMNLANDDILRNLLNPVDVYKDYKPRIHARIADAFKKVLNFALNEYKP